jgi:hypothetical protein
MNDNIVPQLTTAKIFRSVSGEHWTLEDDQIEKIPYLAALVSSAEKFELTLDEHGFYKLDPSIQSKYFTFVLNSLSFQSVRQIFTYLPKQNDIIQIIALFDFLDIARCNLHRNQLLDSKKSMQFSFQICFTNPQQMLIFISFDHLQFKIWLFDSHLH